MKENLEIDFKKFEPNINLLIDKLTKLKETFTEDNVMNIMNSFDDVVEGFRDYLAPVAVELTEVSKLINTNNNIVH